MLTISEQQLNTLNTDQSNKFQEMLYIEIKQQLSPDDLLSISDNELRIRIKYAVDSASDYNINIEKDVVRYVFLIVILGVNFHKDPINDWIVSILESHPPANIRLDQLTNIIQSS